MVCMYSMFIRTFKKIYPGISFQDAVCTFLKANDFEVQVTTTPYVALVGLQLVM